MNSGLTSSPAAARDASTSSSVTRTRLPARSPPACRLVWPGPRDRRRRRRTRRGSRRRARRGSRCRRRAASTTETMPHEMPSIDSAARKRLRDRPCSASRTISRSTHRDGRGIRRQRTLEHRGRGMDAGMAHLVAQRLDRRQLRRAARRIRGRDDADDDQRGERHSAGLPRQDHARKRVGIGSRLTQPHRPAPRSMPSAAAHHREEEAFEEELPLDRARSSRRAPCGRRSRASAPCTAISMMFITPMPPSASVMKPTMREELAASCRPCGRTSAISQRRVPHPDRFAVVGVEALAARQDRADVRARAASRCPRCGRCARRARCGSSSTTHCVRRDDHAATACRARRSGAGSPAPSPRTGRTPCCCRARCSCCPDPCWRILPTTV